MLRPAGSVVLAALKLTGCPACGVAGVTLMPACSGTPAAATVMVLVAVDCAPVSSVTVRLTVKLPAAVGVTDAVAPLVAPTKPLTMPPPFVSAQM